MWERIGLKGNMERFVKYSVAVALMSGDKLWLSQRASTKLFPNYWQFAGGKIEDGENPIAGGVRELKEETGLTVDESRLQYIGSITGDPSTRVCYVYQVDLNSDEVPQRTEPDAMGEWLLLTPDEILKLHLLLPGIKNIIEKLTI